LLFTVAPRESDRLEKSWRKRWPKVRLTRIGRLAADGTREGLGRARGYDHFA
jgi:hypothetical protein